MQTLKEYLTDKNSDIQLKDCLGVEDWSVRWEDSLSQSTKNFLSAICNDENTRYTVDGIDSVVADLSVIVDLYGNWEINDITKHYTADEVGSIWLDDQLKIITINVVKPGDKAFTSRDISFIAIEKDFKKTSDYLVLIFDADIDHLNSEAYKTDAFTVEEKIVIDNRKFYGNYKICARLSSQTAELIVDTYSHVVFDTAISQKDIVDTNTLRKFALSKLIEYYDKRHNMSERKLNND